MTDELTIESIEERLNETKSSSTVKSYFQKIRTIAKAIEGDSLREKFEKRNEIVKWINANPSLKTNATRRAYLSAYKFVLDEFGFRAIDRNAIKNLVRDSAELGVIEQKKKMEQDEIPIEEAEDMLKDLKELYELYKESMSPDVYDHRRSIATFLHLVINYGVLRPSELYKMTVHDGDSTNPNFINRENRVMIIREHKTKANQPIKEIILDDAFMELIKPCKKFIFPMKNGRPYASPDGFSKMIVSKVGTDYYDMRKMKTSLVLDKGDNNEILKLSKIQGHSVQTQLDYYNKYKRGERAEEEKKEKKKDKKMEMPFTELERMKLNDDLEKQAELEFQKKIAEIKARRAKDNK